MGKLGAPVARETSDADRGVMNDAERALRERFDLREEGFVHGDFAVDLLLPRSADELIDDSAFNTDERLPYWADL